MQERAVRNPAKCARDALGRWGERHRAGSIVAGFGSVARHARADHHPEVEVFDLTANGPASAAGLRSGDIITEVNGQACVSMDQRLSLIRDRRDGIPAQFVLIRNHQNMNLTAPVGSNSWTPPVAGPGFIPPATPRPS